MDLVLGQRGSADADAAKTTLKRVAIGLARSIAARRFVGKKILIIGCGSDFDECCLPIVGSLRRQKIEVHTRCYWVDFDAAADVLGDDIALVSQEYSDGEGQYDLAVVLTAIPSPVFLDAILQRLMELDRPGQIEVAPFFIADAARTAITSRYTGVALANDQGQPLVDGRQATSFHAALSDLLARPRRYFRHMPESIDAVLTGRDFEPDSAFTI
ncbi:hypothetical protein [Sinorhizobium terangae]|uniref:hypothetical protein n=1 Tax=Sinorhizobium terangae TaxID=110322 RepID=UPI0024B1670B|nr:hypothetical protein [Sinorhizobium terangae]WFU49134.1 hypothetical protein QA637_06970 [Sinorhizobium terangae]